MSNDQILKTAVEAAKAATEVLMTHFGAAEIEHKDGATHNLVTQADLGAEAAVLKVIQTAFPEHEVLGEEGLSDGTLSSRQLWVVDPLDGTTNYAQGIPQFCTAISYVFEGQVQVGVVFDPCRNELYHAVRGQGAFMNDVRIRVSARNQLSDAVVATGFYYDRGELMRKTLKSIESLFEKNIRGIRRLGSAALDQCWVANGRMDAFYEYQLSPWDYAAASLIVEEAGGRCADRDGLPLQLDSGSLIVTNSQLFEAISSTVKWSSTS